jgi:hypothetical protein
MCPDELDEHSFVWKSHMRHQPIFVAAYVKNYTVIAYEIDGRSKHRFHITRSMPLRPLTAMWAHALLRHYRARQFIRQVK